MKIPLASIFLSIVLLIIGIVTMALLHASALSNNLSEGDIILYLLIVTQPYAIYYCGLIFALSFPLSKIEKDNVDFSICKSFSFIPVVALSIPYTLCGISVIGIGDISKIIDTLIYSTFFSHFLLLAYYYTLDKTCIMSCSMRSLTHKTILTVNYLLVILIIAAASAAIVMAYYNESYIALLCSLFVASLFTVLLFINKFISNCSSRILNWINIQWIPKLITKQFWLASFIALTCYTLVIALLHNLHNDH